MTVSEDVLSSEKHLKLGLLAKSLRFAESLPRVFVKEADAGVKSGAAPNFDGVISGIVQLLKDGEDLFGVHPGREKRLVTVPKGCFDDF